jgi:hypothetical protein
MSFEKIPGAEPNEHIITALTHAMRSGEVPVIGARSHRSEFEGRGGDLAYLYMTE